jgi:hypothetical protein
MTDFLSNLFARSFTDAPVIRPRVASLFETAPDEFFDEPKSATPAIAAPEMNVPTPTVDAHETIAHTEVSAPVSKLSPIEKTLTTKPIANASDALAEKHPPKPDKPGTPTHRPAPMSAQRSQSREQTAERRKLEIETKRMIIPVDSFREEKKDTVQKESPSAGFFERAPRHRRDFLPLEQRSSKSGPIIRVTIGRIDVRAVHQPAAAPKSAKPAPPKLSLDEYLKGGKR